MNFRCSLVVGQLAFTQSAGVRTPATELVVTYFERAPHVRQRARIKLSYQSRVRQRPKARSVSSSFALTYDSDFVIEVLAQEPLLTHMAAAVNSMKLRRVLQVSAGLTYTVMCGGSVAPTELARVAVDSLGYAGNGHAK